jgi:O-acetyl-ADP-ribose deacetylase (regulator of RNase III)
LTAQVVSEYAVGDATVRLCRGDITLADTDAIVNAANSHLQHGGGVAAAIVRRGGAAIQAESDRIGYCPEGEAVVTGAGNLAARYVIHAVGPRGGDPEGDRKLAGAVRSALERACELGLTSISLPAISSGIFGFPKDRCARIMLATIDRYLLERPDPSLRTVQVCLFDEQSLKAFRGALEARRRADDQP